jgi:hypothetical protein
MHKNTVDRIRLLWTQFTYCRRHGHMSTNAREQRLGIPVYDPDYCYNCGKDL